MGSENIKISVIIPTYNRSKLLKRSIRSVLDQTFQPNEIIVVDNGSTDDTREMVSKNFRSICYIYHDKIHLQVIANPEYIKYDQAK